MFGEITRASALYSLVELLTVSGEEMAGSCVSETVVVYKLTQNNRTGVGSSRDCNIDKY